MRTAAPRKLAWALAAASILLGTSRARATGGDDIDEYDSFFAPEIINRPQETPFFLTGHALYPYVFEGSDSRGMAEVDAVNTKEWSAYFRGRVREPNLAYLVYKMKLPELDKLIWVLEGKKQTLSKESTHLKADLDALGNPAQVLGALYYLGFAKRTEPIALRRAAEDAWDPKKLAAASARDRETAARLLTASETQLAGVKDPFLQERYRFQRLRLMFYTGRHADAERYYAEQIGTFATESSVKYRFIEVAAGSFRHDKKYGQANYLYSQVFGRFAPLKRSAYLSFKPVEEADWKGSLALAKDPAERAVLWQLLGLYADGPAAIEKIYALAPASELLPLLLVREVNKAEKDWSENRARRRDGGTGVRSDAAVVGKKRLALVKRLADENKVYSRSLWLAAAGHLHALAGETAPALAYLEMAEKSVGADADLAGQIRMSRLFARIQGTQSVDRSLEPFWASELGWLKGSKNPRAAALDTFARGVLRDRYAKAKDPLRALLLVDDPDSEQYQSNRRIDGILEFLARPDKPPFDAYLSARYAYSKAQLLELKAIHELYAGRLKAAADLLAQAGPEIGSQKLRADPFLIHIRDCHDCDFEAKGAGTYTKASFLRRLIELMAKADGTGPEAAKASFELGNGFYNMSYYGNARDVYVTAHGNFADEIPMNLNMQLAGKYYKRALERAPDKEQKARACFMAAKVEQNEYFNKQRGPSGTSGSSGTGPEPVHSPVHFKLLKDAYSDTRYYQEVIRECAYFRSFVKP